MSSLTSDTISLLSNFQKQKNKKAQILSLSNSVFSSIETKDSDKELNHDFININNKKIDYNKRRSKSLDETRKIH